MPNTFQNTGLQKSVSPIEENKPALRKIGMVNIKPNYMKSERMRIDHLMTSGILKESDVLLVQEPIAGMQNSLMKEMYAIENPNNLGNDLAPIIFCKPNLNLHLV